MGRRWIVEYGGLGKPVVIPDLDIFVHFTNMICRWCMCCVSLRHVS